MDSYLAANVNFFTFEFTVDQFFGGNADFEVGVSGLLSKGNLMPPTVSSNA